MKKLFAIGLIFLFISQILFSVHSEKINLLEPIDFIHWLILVGLTLIIPYSVTLSKGLYHKIGATVTLIGIVCSIGMCTIDFVLWTFRNNSEERNEMARHLMNEELIWSVFITIGPAFFFIGFAIQALGYFRENLVGSVSTIIGSIIVAIGEFVFPEYRIIYLFGYLIFIFGLLLISFKKNEL